MKRDRRDPRRGRHRRRRSPETRAFEALHAPPPCPGWLAPAAYAGLVRLKHRLELDDGEARA